MTNEKMTVNLWSMANGITSFAVLQAPAFLFALGGEGFVNAIAKGPAQAMIIPGTLIFTGCYCYAVWKCKDLVKAIDTKIDTHSRIWSTVTIGRISCIVAFNLLVLIVDFVTAKSRGVW